MTTRTFIVPGEPQGKARARVYYNSRIGRSVAVTPDQTVSYENLVKLAYTAKHPQCSGMDPVSLRIGAFYGMPKSASRKKLAAMLAGEIRPCKKPDSDNIIKIVADALNGVAWHDDSCVTDVVFMKRYAENPRVEVEIEMETK